MADNPDITLAVKDLLLADTTLSDLVNNQVFIERLPQSKQNKMILIWVVVETPWNHLEGAVGIDQCMLQINAYGDTPAQAREIAWVTWKLLDGFQGVSNNVHILGAHRFSGVSTSVDKVREGTDEYRYIAMQDFRFTYNSCEKVT